MNAAERLRADFSGMNLTTGPASDGAGARRNCRMSAAREICPARNGQFVRIAGNVICRQRPGTAKGFVFISLEDETGMSNAIVTPQLFEKLRLVITQESFLSIRGPVQNTDNVVLVKATHIEALREAELEGSESHDFH